MKNKDTVILEKIWKNCNQIQETCEYFGNSYEKFANNFIFTNACCMCILQIGELCKTISEELRMEEKRIPWKSWCGIRDVFAHQYANVDYKIAWETIREDVPQLKKEIKEILEKRNLQAKLENVP